jgi:hypothetical protein
MLKNRHSEPGKFDHDLITYASGMVSIQASCPVPAALALMADHARFADLSMAEIADAVVTEELAFC